MPSSDTTPKPFKTKVSLSLDYRVILLVLLAIIGGMLIAWKPWQSSPDNNDRTISVTGESKITAQPDEYMFSPSYEFKNANKDAALTELTKKSDEVVAKLKELGIPDNKIKTNSSGYDYGLYYYDSDSRTNTYTLQLTITVDNRELAQKVQDYLVSTSPTGAVSPQATFSDAKRKELESKARDEATKEARGKADQSAKNLGFKVGKVKTVQDGAGFGSVEPYGRPELSTTVVEDMAKLSVQPGENDLHYSVTVVYFVR